MRIRFFDGPGRREAVAAKPSGKITNEAKTIGRFYGMRQREVHCDVRFTPKSGHCSVCF
jgi:hypothetical protein